MKGMRTAVLALALVAGLLAPGAANGRVAVDKSENVQAVYQHEYTGGSELAWSGNFVYAGQINGQHDRGEIPEQGGVFIYNVKGKKPKLVGQIECPGNDNDVATVKKGLLAIGHHTNQCNRWAGNGNGVLLVDVKNPKKPKLLGGVPVPSAHTITPFPGKPLIYVSPGGLANGGGVTQIVDVKNPKKPVVAATFTPQQIGCHDLSFFIGEDRQLAFCAGEGEVQIWDVSDPLAPTTLSRVVNPTVQFGHYALASPDGNIMVIDDEAFVAHTCGDLQASPTGAAWIYDISNPMVPVPAGRFAPPRGGDGGPIPVGHYAGWTPSWCTSHHFNFKPGTRDLVISWFTGGTSILDLSDPMDIVEKAYYQPDDTIAYTSHWYKGRVYINDMNRGFEQLKIKK